MQVFDDDADEGDEDELDTPQAEEVSATAKTDSMAHVRAAIGKSGSTRPVQFSMYLATVICERIAIGQPLQTICLDETMPTVTQVNKWLLRSDKFAEIYEHARTLQADYLADEALVIIAEMRANPLKAAGLKAAADLLAKQAEWRAPRKYGPKMELNLNERPKTPDEIKAEIARLRDELGVPKGRIARLK